MSFPKPVPALVIRYSYLWREEHQKGQEEGVKDRPCAIVVVTQDEDGDEWVTVVPVTHVPPNDLASAIEIPRATKVRLGLDDERSWVVLTEANRFIWPGPDLRPAKRGDAASVAYGLLPAKFYEQLIACFLQLVQSEHGAIVPRTE